MFPVPSGSQTAVATPVTYSGSAVQQWPQWAAEDALQGSSCSAHRAATIAQLIWWDKRVIVALGASRCTGTLQWERAALRGRCIARGRDVLWPRGPFLWAL